VSPEPYLGDTARTPIRHHILSVLVENKPGVLARIAGLFARRGFNIYSLAVAPAESHARFSRVTIVVDAESAPLEQIVGQLDKLVNVVAISDLSPRDARRKPVGRTRHNHPWRCVNRRRRRHVGHGDVGRHSGRV
jgi:acetolactate synthase regulatory subunit